ncbi:guanine deaminase-like protein [Hapsidospora chrysogenum ATCC 11550]|uniref:Probable guanine deaminase n=1 Tax=Hapsidospora chrysogenum (strain ATCC 11550 / CBS 779.69 / DSM 880 / IAM 14645 / JCM 23072 / IMI 49137) TaxID=857340 RepID=A0A086T5E2_HAPC1|nr:guanine deaminase-like protein [Hapsidospora chrysogenum ATCC 11550]
MASQVRRQVFLGTFIHSRSRTELEYLHDSAVCVDEHGVIVKVERGGCGGSGSGSGSGSGDTTSSSRLLQSLGWSEGEVDVVACREGEFFFPGFIDTHVHASQYPNVGIFGKTTLLDWLDKYTFPLEASLSDLGKARRVYTACVRRTLRHGTTTAAYYATVDVAATNLLADLCLSLGQRALVGRVCMDSEATCPSYYRDESAAESLERTRQTIEHVRAIDPGFELVGPVLTPRFAPSCTGEAMRGLAEMQREMDLPVQTHISENRGEVALVERLFRGSRSYADVYDAHGLLTGRTVLAHAVHLSEEEAALVRDRGSKVAHCPCSNSSLTSGTARVRWLWGRGIDVGLGTDMSGGYSPSVLEAARQAALVSRHVAMNGDGEGEAETEAEAESHKLTVEEVLYLATRGGAVVLGMEDRVGGFEVGKQWDAQLVGFGRPVRDQDGDGQQEEDEDEDEEDEGNVDVFGWEDWEERMAKWLYVGDDRNTKKVWVRGRLVHARRGRW